jgi:hypothetical protein
MATTFTAIDESTLFGLQTGKVFGNTYPAGADGIKFGVDPSIHADFVTPVAAFKFYDATGSDTGRPTIYIRMPGTFNTTLLQGYGDSAGIFGRIRGQNQQTFIDALGSLGESALAGVQSQVAKGFAGALGFGASAGQSGRAQLEFNQRKLINNFQQLIYQGPQYRRYQLPFSMKPVSQTEAENMIKIIQCFQVASAPQALNKSDILVDNPDALEDTGNFVSTAGAIQAGEEVSQQELAESQAAFDDFRASELAKEIDILAFSYPDMCKFQILLYRGSGGGTDLDTLFESEVCMIESVAVDYGSQNKMTFFDKGDSGQYYPTDVNISIALREAVLPTAASIAASHKITTKTIF